MKWSFFLHIYQPSDQHPGILEKIVNESYRPLFKGLYKIDRAKVTLNINAVLTEMLFKNGYRDVLDDIKALVEMGRLELTGSAKFHAFLPLLPEDEIERQIKLNFEANKTYLGEAFSPQGFFSPEMAYSPKVASVVEKMGYKWILADESAFCDESEKLSASKIYKIKGYNLNIYAREKRPTNLLMGALVRSSETLSKAMGERMKANEYVILAMDGETFGHHRPGLEEALFSTLKSPDFEHVFISDLENHFKETAEVMPMDSTWASSVEDIKSGNPFIYWFNKNNKIHDMQWELAQIAMDSVKKSKYSDEKYPVLLEETKNWEEFTSEEKKEEEKKRNWVKARDALDRGLNSDPFWWACAVPWWSVEMIEKGMNALYKIVLSVPDSTEEQRARAEELYLKILFTAHEWQRTGVVDQMSNDDKAERKIPLSKRFAASDHYRALLEALHREEKRASERREYEQAIKWRDGQYKLERDLDIYDAIHVMDLFRSEGNFKEFEEILKEYRQKYQIINKGQPE